MGIAHNRWRNARRKDRFAAQIDTPSETASDEPSPSRMADLRQDLEAALCRLSGDERTAVHLCYQQGLSHSETAAVVSWPIGTVKTHLARAKEKLRTHLAAWSHQT
jgi:RNA polymerase sigma factor (sigma-70 family)